MGKIASLGLAAISLAAVVSVGPSGMALAQQTPPACDGAQPNPTEAFVNRYNEMMSLISRRDYARAEERFPELEAVTKGASQNGAVIGMKVHMLNGLGKHDMAMSEIEAALAGNCLTPSSRSSLETTLRALRKASLP